MALYTTIFNLMKDKKMLLTATGITLAVGVITLWWKSKYRKEKKKFPLDTVVLYQIARGRYAPSPIPFVMKLETYLRMARIPYQYSILEENWSTLMETSKLQQGTDKLPIVVFQLLTLENNHDMKPSSKGKFPWIEYNGKAISDSEFCIEYLNQLLGIDLNEHLTKEERAIGRAFQKMVEENTYWTFVLDRMVYDSTWEAYDMWKVPKILRGLLKSRTLSVTSSQGMGRHSQEEVLHILRLDLQALSDFLGTKQYLFGDNPSQYDCSIFGLLSEMRWQSDGGFQGKIIKEYPNLCDYCDRMKDQFWPDWDKCITNGHTSEAAM